MSLPESVLVRCADVMAYLGVSKTTLKKWHDSGVLKRCCRGKYSRRKVLALAEQLEAGEA